MARARVPRTTSPVTVIAHDENIVLPADANNAHYERERVIVIGKTVTNVSVADAKPYVFGITVGNLEGVGILRHRVTQRAKR